MKLVIDKDTNVDITDAIYAEGVVDLPRVVASRNNLESRILSTQDTIKGVANIILVASGKGGVGKSSMAVSLAKALVDLGAKVGLLDADIYGPSLPLMTGSSQRASIKNEKILPIQLEKNLSVISIAHLVHPDQDIVWRGPRASGMLKEILLKTEWPDVDYLFIDMPPGTGDIHLTVAQTIAAAGAIIVTTPHKVAYIDAQKGINMLRKVEIPILGIIENMAYSVCDSCSHVQKVSDSLEYAAPLLGSVPINRAFSHALDSGLGIHFAQQDFTQKMQEIVVAALVNLSSYNNEQEVIEIEN